jgi:hypothetical protein
MRRYALLLVVLTAGTVAAGSALDEIAHSLQPWDHVGGTGIPTTGLVVGDAWTSHSALPTNLPLMNAIRPMEVSVSPERPMPFEEVFVTISGQTFDPYLTLDGVTIDRRGNNIVIDLQWSTYIPPSSGSETSNGLQLQAYQGWGVALVRPTPSGMPTPEPYEVTRSLGGFDVGTYQIRVHSHGALSGEARGSFQVGDGEPALSFLDLLQMSWW